MKSQDLIEDSKKIPEGRKINWDFHFSRVFFRKKGNTTPCGCNFCFIGFRSGSKHERKSTLILIPNCKLLFLIEKFQ